MRSIKKTFCNAFRGVWYFLKNEPNNRLHLTLAALALIGGWYFHIAPFEWLAIILCIGMVLGAEAFNSALEHLGDVVEPNTHEGIRKAKDISAGAVLVAAITSVVVALVIFGGRLLEWAG
jgi:diacylglycerol kinase (ATP)